MFERLKNIVTSIPPTPTKNGVYMAQLPDGRFIHYTVTTSHRKTMSIQLSGTGGVIVKCPTNYPHNQIEKFILEKSSWIFEKQRYYKSLSPAQLPPEFHDGSQHMILGDIYTLTITNGIRTFAQLDKDTQTINLETAPKITNTQIKNAVIDLYKRTANDIFPKRLERCFTAFENRGHTMPSLTIKSFKGRWGSMSHDKKMMLNTWLIRANLDCIDYVITHELCHMEHMDHSTNFYNLQTLMYPNWKTTKSTLDKIQITDI